MRTWVILISVLSILISIVAAENIIISDFEKEADVCIAQINATLDRGKADTNDLVNIQQMWNERKNPIYMLANHNSFSSIENSIALMQECVKSNNMAEFRFQLIIFEKCVESIVESSTFSIANIF